MNFFKQMFEKRAEPEKVTPSIESELLSIIMSGNAINTKIALGIPVLASAINLISSMVASVTYKLYTTDEKGNLKECDDRRVRLLNKETGDLLNGYEMKRAFVRDYLLMGNGYIYIEKWRNEIESLRYVKEINVSVNKNCDPIFKVAKYIVNGVEYYPDQFLTIARNSEDGVTGKGILEENALSIRLVNNMLKMLNSSVSGGGVKKGFLKSQKGLTREAMDKLKEDFRKMYNNEENAVIVLNNGMEFDPATETSTEMQLQELYNGIGEDIGEILLVPQNIINGKANENEYRNWFKNCILPILNEICASLNEQLLLESEKDNYFWQADISSIENGDIKSMFEAYKIALDANILQLDEVRKKLGHPPLGFNYIKLGLDSVLMDTEKGIIYTPNTNSTTKMNEIDKKMDKNGFIDPTPKEGENG